MASVQTILGLEVDVGFGDDFFSITAKWRCHNNLGQFVTTCLTLPPSISSSFFPLRECHPISRPFLVYNILLAILHSLSRLLFLYAFITHRHLLSLPISISSSYLNTSRDDSLHLHPSSLILFFILSPSPPPSADQPVTSVPVAIYFLGPFCSPKHPLKYIISGILLHLYILPLSFLSGIPLIVTSCRLVQSSASKPDGHSSYPSRHLFVFTSITELYPVNINQIPVFCV